MRTDLNEIIKMIENMGIKVVNEFFASASWVLITDIDDDFEIEVRRKTIYVNENKLDLEKLKTKNIDELQKFLQERI